MKTIIRAVGVAALFVWLTACSPGFFPSALSIPAGAVISPPVSTLEKKPPDQAASRPASAEPPRLSLFTLKDRRESASLVRSVSGYQGWLYHATGWRIESRERVDEIVTSSVRDHLERNGIRTAGPDRRIALNVDGEIRKFYVNKTGNLEDSWEAFVEITITMNRVGRSAPLKIYHLNGYAEQYNWRGAASGAQALTEALEEAVKQIPARDIRVLTESLR